MQNKKLMSAIIVLLLLSSGFTASLALRSLPTLESFLTGSLTMDVTQEGPIFTVFAEDGTHIRSDGENVKFSMDLGTIHTSSINQFNISIQNSTLPDNINSAWIHVDGIKYPARLTATVDTNEDIYRIGGNDWILNIEHTNRTITFSLVLTEESEFQDGMYILLDFSISPYQDEINHEENNETASYWSLNENSGDIAHDELNENDGSIIGGTWTTGLSGSGLLFDGQDDHIIISDEESLDLNDTVTLMAWIHPSSINGIDHTKYNYIISKNYAYSLSIGEDGKLQAFIGDRTISSPTNLSTKLNTWIHVAVTYDSEMIRLYINGSESASLSNINPITMNDADLFIGYGGSSDRYFHGLIDEIYLYQNCLEPSEIYNYYLQSKPEETSLISYWRFDEATGNQTLDSIGENDGTIHDSTWTNNGVNESALEFNGQISWVEIPDSNSLDTTEEITISLWTKTLDQITAKLVEKDTWNSGWSIHQDVWDGWKATLHMANGTTIDLEWGEGLPELDTWYHIAVTYDGSNFKMYVNGTQKASTPSEGIIQSNNEPVSIGSDEGTIKFFNGTIDEVMIFNKGLSSQEIGELYTIFSEALSDTTNQTEDETNNTTPNTNETNSSLNQTGLNEYWMVGYNTYSVYHYDSNFTYTGLSYALSELVNANEQVYFGDFRGRDITQDSEGNWYVVENLYDDIWKFYHNWTYAKVHYDLTDLETNPEGICFGDDGYLYVVGWNTDTVYQLFSNGSYTGNSFDISSESNYPTGIYQDLDGYFWLLDSLEDAVFQYDSNWIYTGNSYSTKFGSFIVDGTNGYGLCQDLEGYWYITDIEDNAVNQYHSNWTFTGNSYPYSEDSVQSGIIIDKYEEEITEPPVQMNGSGTIEDPYQITSIEELQMVNDDLEAYYILLNDINASETVTWNNASGFVPIGTQSNYFKGGFDGNNHTIYNLYINRPDTTDVGLFGYTGWESDYICNIGLSNVNFTGGYRTGGLGARIDTPIENSWVTGTITGMSGNSVVGGFIGQSHDTVQNCYAQVDCSGQYEVSGFIAFNNGETYNSYSTGLISCIGNREAGFAVDADGHGEGVISNCFYDIESSGQTLGIYQDSEGASVTGKNTLEMKDVITFTDLTTIGLIEPWDFVNDPYDDISSEDWWNISAAYPTLTSFNISINSGETDDTQEINGLVSYWSFDEIHDSTVNDTVSGNDGTLFGTLNLQDGMIDDSLFFDGTTYIKVEDATDFQDTSSFSFSLWINASDSSDYKYIIDKWYYSDENSTSYNNRSWSLNFEYGNLIWRGSNNGRDNGEQRISYLFDGHLNTWTHIVGTYDGSDLSLYINGYLINTVSLSNMISTDKPLLIGSGNYGGWWNFVGLMDEIMFFNRVVTVEEIQLLYELEPSIPSEVSFAYDRISINEVNSNPALGNDWIELYNPTDDPINLAGMYLSDDHYDERIWQIPSDNPIATTIPSDGYLVVEYSNDYSQPTIISDILTIPENIGGEDIINLYDPDGTIVDSVILDDSAHSDDPDLSFSMCPDGGDEYIATNQTRDSPNDCGQNPSGSIAISNWKFDENIGDIVYDTNNDNNGFLTGTTWVTGVEGSGLEFNGTNSSIEIPGNETLDIEGTSITLEAWVKWNVPPDSANSWANIIFKDSAISWGPHYQLQHSTGNSKFEFVISTINSDNAWIQSTTSPEQNVWYHIVGVYDGTQMHIYVNGVLENSKSVSGTLKNSGNPCYIGSKSQTERFFNGVLDEISIYDIALSQEDIATRFTQMVPSTSSSSDTETNDSIPVVNETDWINFSSNLPIIMINTQGETIVDEPKIPAEMTVFYDPTSERNSIYDTAEYEGYIGIEIRGQLSQTYPKKQYGIETWELNDGDYEDMAVELFGMPEEEDWILQGPYDDKTLMRNYFAYNLSNQIGMYAVRTKFVEVFLNSTGSDTLEDQYNGVYVFMEKIKRDSNRVDIEKLKSNDVNEPKITGGYILKIDKVDSGDNLFTTDNGTKIIIDYPDADDIVAEQEDWIINYINEFETALSTGSFDDPDSGYTEYIDVDSFVDYKLINELLKNVDAFRISTYMSKDRNEKLTMGPVWDFNWAIGSTLAHNGIDTRNWVLDEISPSDFYQAPFWWDALLQDPVFVTRLIERWNELRATEFSDENLFQIADDAASILNEAQARNFERWPEKAPSISYEYEVNWMKNWLSDRAEWIDNNIESLMPGYETHEEQNTTENSSLAQLPYYNQFNTTQGIEFTEPSYWSIATVDNENMLWLNGWEYSHALIGNSSWTNYEITTLSKKSGSSVQGFIFRYQDENNFWRLVFENGKAIIRGKVDGEWVDANNSNRITFTPLANIWYTIKINVNGSVIKAKYWNENEEEPEWLLTADDNRLLSGKVGYAATGNYLFDDLYVIEI